MKPQEDSKKYLLGIPSYYKEGLVFRKVEMGVDRLYILRSYKKDIFKLTYNNKFYTRFNRAYTIVRNTYYIYLLSKKLRTYI